MEMGMPRSMTGFARVVFPTSKGNIAIEVKSVNHRFLDVSFRIPHKYSALEDRIKKEISNRFTRGRIDCSIFFEKTDKKIDEPCLNLPLARAYHNLYRQLKDELQLHGEVDIPLMSNIRELITFKEEIHDVDSDWEEIKENLERCLDELRQMRQKEGQVLFLDIEARIDRINSLNDNIQERTSKAVDGFEKRLKERLEGRLNGIEVDPARLHQEIVYYSERSDISEECVRMSSHIEQFRNLAGSQEAVGRKLDFLLQEMHREATTMGAKAADAPISHMVVEVKGELEKIREQIQNIE
jgi:uncharacterized protein (TIGR00255 family)